MFHELVVMADHLQVGLHVQPCAVLCKMTERVAVADVLLHPLEGVVVVLLIDDLHMG